MKNIKGVFLLLLFFCFLTGCGKFFDKSNSSEINIIVKLILECPQKFRLFLSNFFVSFLYVSSYSFGLVNPILLCILLLLYHISIYSYILLLKLSRLSKFSLCTYSFFNVAWNDSIQALS